MTTTTSIPWKLTCLFLAAGAHYLAAGNRPVGIAVWLAPLLLLRAFRDIGPIKAALVALPMLTGVSALANRGMIPIPSVPATLIVHGWFAAVALIPYLVEGLARRLQPRVLQVLLFPSLVVAVPFVRGTDWTYIHPVTSLDDLALLQVTSLAGVAGVVFVVSLAAAAVNDIWEQRQSWGAARVTAGALLGLVLAVYGFGTIRLREETAPQPRLRAAAIVTDPSMRAKLESSIATFLRPGSSRAAEIEALRQEWKALFDRLLSDSAAAGGAGFDLAAWSEGAAIVFEEDEPALLRRAANVSRANRMHLAIALMVYMTSVRPTQPGPFPVMVNKLVLFGPTGEIEWEHHKGRLAPGLETAVTIRGTGTLQTSRDGISGAICYEMDFPRYIRQAGRLGAGVLLAPSNDWDVISHAHARSARLRAIENGVSLFRPTAGGVSLAADPYGRTLARLDQSRSVDAPMTAILPATGVRTLYVAWGDWVGWPCLCLVAISAVAVVTRIAGRHRRRG